MKKRTAIILIIFIGLSSGLVAEAKRNKSLLSSRPSVRLYSCVSNKDLFWCGMIRSNYYQYAFPFTVTSATEKGLRVNKVYFENPILPGDLIVKINGKSQCSNYVWMLGARLNTIESDDLTVVRNGTTNTFLCGKIPVGMGDAYQATNWNIISSFGLRIEDSGYRFGVRITSVDSNSLGMKAGLQIGDVILFYNNMLIKDLKTLKDILALTLDSSSSLHSAVRLEVLRHERTMVLQGGLSRQKPRIK